MSSSGSPNLKHTKSIFYRALFGFVLASLCLLIMKWLMNNSLLNNNLKNQLSHISLTRNSRSNGHSGHILVRNMVESGASSSDIATMSNFFNKMYTGQVQIGTPIQEFQNIVFDTGSADLWVLSVDSNIDDDYLSYYNPSDSSTYSSIDITSDDEWNIQYGTGFAKGIAGKDNIIIADLTATNQIFAQATYVQDMSISEYEPQDGIAGFARKNAATLIDYGTTFMQTLINNNQNQLGLFSFYLSKHSDIGSKLIFGDDVFNDDYYYKDNLNIFNVNDDINYEIGGLWSIHLDEIRINNNDYVLTPSYNNNNDNNDNSGYISAIFDTGTTYIGIPSSQYNIFMKILTSLREDCKSQSSSSSTEDVYICQDIINPTSNLPTISFIATSITGESITMNLDSSSYLDDSNELGFMPLPGLDIWIMGDSFLKNYYSIYDYKLNQIHLAPSKYNDNMLSNLMITVLIISIITVSILLLLSCIRYFVTKNQIKYLSNNALLNQQMNFNDN